MDINFIKKSIMKLWRNLAIAFGIFAFGGLMEFLDVNQKHLSKELPGNVVISCLVVTIIFAILSFFFWDKYNKTKKIG